MSGPFRIDEAARARIAQVWRQRVSLLGHPRPTVSQVATAAETTCWQVRKMLGGLVAEDGQEDGVQGGTREADE